MKYIISIALALTIAAASAYAGCNKKMASIGTIEKFDAATKTLVVSIYDSSNPKEIKSKSAKLTMTPDSTIVHAGKVNGVSAADVVGKKASILSEHGKIDYVVTLVEGA